MLVYFATDEGQVIKLLMKKAPKYAWGLYKEHRGKCFRVALSLSDFTGDLQNQTV
jgi:hypothetical protein